MALTFVTSAHNCAAFLDVSTPEQQELDVAPGPLRPVPSPLRPVLDRIRYRGPPVGLELAYAVFEILLGDVLLRESQHVDRDAARMLQELEEDVFAACAERWVVRLEFDMLLTTVLRNGSPTDLEAAKMAWPAAQTSRDLRLLQDFAQYVDVWTGEVRQRDGGARLDAVLDELRQGRPGDPTRIGLPPQRGRPRRPEVDGLVMMVLRERVFKNGRSQEAAEQRAVRALGGTWKAESFHQRLKALRRDEPHVPDYWKKSFFASRIVPLHGDDLRVR